MTNILCVLIKFHSHNLTVYMSILSVFQLIFEWINGYSRWILLHKLHDAYDYSITHHAMQCNVRSIKFSFGSWWSFVHVDVTIIELSCWFVIFFTLKTKKILLLFKIYLLPLNVCVWNFIMTTLKMWIDLIKALAKYD